MFMFNFIEQRPDDKRNGNTNIPCREFWVILYKVRECAIQLLRTRMRGSYIITGQFACDPCEGATAFRESPRKSRYNREFTSRGSVSMRNSRAVKKGFRL